MSGIKSCLVRSRTIKGKIFELVYFSSLFWWIIMQWVIWIMPLAKQMIISLSLSHSFFPSLSLVLCLSIYLTACLSLCLSLCLCLSPSPSLPLSPSLFELKRMTLLDVCNKMIPAIESSLNLLLIIIEI